jgi:hypothetical protein
MNVYLADHGGWVDTVLLGKILDCNIQTYNLESDTLLENSLFIIEQDYIITFENVRPDIINIKNKKLLVVNHHKSMSCMYIKDIETRLEIFKKLGFEEKNIYFITQLEYDKEFILNGMPGINVLAYDKWLNQMFERQVTPFQYGFFSYGPNQGEREIITNNLEMKRFSILIRRPEKRRFEFMCHLIANGILNNCNYTFVNHTPAGDIEWTVDDFKKLIPEELESSRSAIESWITGIPYQTKTSGPLSNGLYEHDDYPLLIAEYFHNSKINIVFETEPAVGTSFLTEKTYKAMLYKKPFIIVTRQNGLKALRKGGYQTFGHVINESYDDIANYSERVSAILQEIIRLNNLPDDEFDNLINSCSPMIEHNNAHLYDEAFKYIPSEFRIKAMTTF